MVELWDFSRNNILLIIHAPHYEGLGLHFVHRNTVCVLNEEVADTVHGSFIEWPVAILILT